MRVTSCFLFVVVVGVNNPAFDLSGVFKSKFKSKFRFRFRFRFKLNGEDVFVSFIVGGWRLTCKLFLELLCLAGGVSGTLNGSDIVLIC